MEKVLIFAGTGEGRRLAEYLSESGLEVHVSVATEYGEEVLEKNAGLNVHRGRLTEKEMEQLLGVCEWKAIIDATHPYAVLVSQNLKKACKSAGQEYLRLQRDSYSGQKEGTSPIYVDTKEEAAAFLNREEGNILFTTGSKELKDYIALIEDKDRIFARFLADASVIGECKGLGLTGKQMICMQGPFSARLNAAMLLQVDARFLVTKDTGAAGGFPEKLKGAKMAGSKVIVIRRPLEESGMSEEKLLVHLGLPRRTITRGQGTGDMQEEADPKDSIGLTHQAEKRVVPEGEKEITLIGIGMGTSDGMTGEAVEALSRADVILGAERMLESAVFFKKPMFSMYKTEEILEFVKRQSYKNIAVILSGDVGFYSGAKKLGEAVKSKGMRLRLICGIPSVVYFCSRLEMPWEDVKLLSIHGREQNVIGAVRRHKKVFSLASGAAGIRKLSQDLISYGLEQVRMHVGYQLSYPEEAVLSGHPKDFLDYGREGLSVVLIENMRSCGIPVTHGLPDETFIRGKAPMTKEEIRSISLSKLELTEDAVVYDVGAGTGSVAVECALIVPRGTVYAVEKKAEALELLKINKYENQAGNLNILAGTAPEALEDLPAPTHAFIGGSSGNLSAIVELLVKKNPEVRIVINAIALETVAEISRLLEDKKPKHTDVVQVSVSKAKELGKYHTMMGQNPVYIVTIQGGME